MDLLTAVNRILPKLGEHPVTNLNSRSPTMAVLLPMFESRTRDLIAPGWWFNTHCTTLYHDPETGEIALPPTAMSFIADDAVCSIRGGKLHDSDGNTFVWNRAVSGTMIDYVPFEELPESAAAYVFANVAVEACVTDIGLTDEVRVWQTQIAPTYATMMSEHLRNKRYSTTNSRRYKNLRRALRG